MWLAHPDQIVQWSITLSALTVAPLLLCLTTSFTRIIIVMSFIRQGVGMGIPSTVITGLSLFLTVFSMQDVFVTAYNNGYNPLFQQQITHQKAIKEMIAPFRSFMRRQVSEKELTFMKNMNDKLVKSHPTSAPTESILGEFTELKILIPAFVLSEVKRGFECGFLLLLPFLIIDILVAAVLLSLGMMMMQPQAISLPLKLAFFMLIDGWMLASKVAVFGG
jgi:flagellar biosynthetic protein FliP